MKSQATAGQAGRGQAVEPGGHPAPEDTQADVTAFLEDPQSYGPDVREVERFDTHAAMVFLAGDRAYKIKRAVRYPYLDFSSLDKRAEEIKDRLIALPEVSQVELLGFSVRQIRIEPDLVKLRQYGLSVADVALAVERQSLDLPAGTVETGEREVGIWDNLTVDDSLRVHDNVTVDDHLSVGGNATISGNLTVSGRRNCRPGYTLTGGYCMSTSLKGAGSSQTAAITCANEGGAVADYIPQLSRVNPNQYAAAITTIDGQRLAMGDSDTLFCVQSSSKTIIRG